MAEAFNSPHVSTAAEKADRFAFACLAATAASILISIAAAQIFLGMALMATLARRNRADLRVLRLPFAIPLAALFVWTVLAAVASSDVHLGLTIVKKFYLFAVIFLTPLLLRGKSRISQAYQAIFAVSAVSAAAGIVQFLLNPHRDLLQRISGFMSHWMTYSGLLMLVLVALGAYLCCYGLGKTGWPLILGVMLAVALILSLTRNAWMGATAGLFVVFAALHRLKAVLAFLALLALLSIGAPAGVRSRLISGLDPRDPNTSNRIELMQTALRLIRDNPWFGVGPKNVNKEALRYRGTNEFPDWLYQHMHNNFLQIAAERGLPGMLIWVWFMARLAWDAWRIGRKARLDARQCGSNMLQRQALFSSAAALGCWAALLIAGLFEYNFGDSEVLVLFLFITGAPYAAEPEET